MKILLTVQNFPPDIGGMAEVTKQVACQLRNMGHEIYVATTKNPDRKSNLDKIIVFEFDPKIKDEQSRYIDFVVEGEWDIVVNFAAQQWATDLLLPNLERIRAKKILVPTGFSGLHQPKFKKYYEDLPNYLKQYDHLIFHGQEYQDFLFSKDFIGSNWSIIPNGASKDEFVLKEPLKIRSKLHIPKNHRLVITIGSHNGLKGHDEAVNLFKETNLSEVTFVIVGNFYQYSFLRKAFNKFIRGHRCPNSCMALQSAPYFDSDSNKSIQIATLDRKETIELFFEADLFLFLSKIECSPIVIYEAMASGTPFLSHDVGNVKEIIASTEAGEILSKDNSLAQIQLTDLLADKNKMNRLSSNGRDAFLKKFNWENIGLLYENCFNDVLKNKRFP